MKLSIILLNYNKPDLTSECVASVYKIHAKEFIENEIEIIIVDNKSTDNSLALLKKEIAEKKYKNVLLVPNSSNAGFGAGNNFGVKKAKGEYVVFLNNDTIVKDDGLTKMLAYMETHDKVGILGGQLKNTDGTLQASVGSFYTLPRVLMLLLGFQKYGLLDRSPSTIEAIDWVKGGLLMMQKAAFEKIGGFDENIFMYTEDMELCYRAKKHGFTSFFYPFVEVLHKEHGSTNRTFAIVHIYSGLKYFYKKYMSKTEQNMLQLLLTTKALLLIDIGKLTNNEYLRTTYEQALAAIR